MAAPVIIVTGVSRGIGRAIALELQSRGAAVVGAAPMPAIQRDRTSKRERSEQWRL
jgi:NAD(P)-dependent dehydrogenase (short-subunit alcohol dehydrogenase family)